MTPVSLKLQNFLSYGTAAEALDFERFHVACLSGGNGQGKSALLDAITWAIWGEARKSSDARKPDEDLLRIGTREMQVELVFDLEDDRYRVVRSFYRTASGKTTKPGLEFQIYEPEGGDYRPLTGGSVRETQATIEETIGLDYDTFINSAFLLQGRSDEFTKKKPSERKEILGRILGLNRYERLAAVARGRYSEANEHCKTAEREIDRLNAALEDEGRWKEERQEVQRHLAGLEAERTEVEAEEKRLTERLAELDALARSTEDQRARRARLASRREELAAERAELKGRIDEAEALIERSEAIRRAHARYEKLLDERRSWDDKADLKRGLDTQHSEQKIALQRKRMEAEGRLDRIENELKANRRQRDEAERRLTERNVVERALEKARAAHREFETLRARRDERRTLDERITAIDKQLAGERGVLKGRIGDLKIEIRKGEEQVARLPDLRREMTGLRKRAGEAEALQQAQGEVREEGSGVKAEIEGLERERERISREVAAVDEKVAGLRELETETCPTCGTPLTDDHRATVEATYAAERSELEARREELGARITQRQERRQDLLDRFGELRDRLQQMNGVADRLADVQASVAEAERAETQQTERRTRLAELDEQLRTDAFRPDLRAERTDLDERLAEIPFDPERFDAVQAQAAKRSRYEEQLRELDELQGRVETLGQQVEQGEREAAALRKGLGEGTLFAELQGKIERLQAQLEKVGYDGQRHEAVRRELDGLKDAPERFMRLANAERNLTDWTGRRSRLAEEIEAAEAEAGVLAEKIEAAQARLDARDETAAALKDVAERRGALTTRLSETQSRRGSLDERLERCARDRETLRSVKARFREAKQQRTLYRHLRSAFGKNGIPALIIEETLPEIEDRANSLLERLAKSRTRVHLETLKDKKTGGTKETLDIKITDSGGVPRPYETFSGGEAFRVNFALRIALAQLLAERSGVRIRTLVVDEGFGTQDKQGIESLVEAIQVIQEDFDKIVVITHLDELKEAFPVRIEVAKHPVEGSNYDVIGV